MINNLNLNDAIGLLIADDETFEKLKTDFPNTLADLVTFKSNPNCSCRGRVVKFFSDELSKNPTVLDKYIKNKDDFSAKINSLTIQRNLNNYSGKIIKIENTDEAWKNLSQSLAGKIFRSFSIIEKDNYLLIYLL